MAMVAFMGCPCGSPWAHGHNATTKAYESLRHAHAWNRDGHIVGDADAPLGVIKVTHLPTCPKCPVWEATNA